MIIFALLFLQTYAQTCTIPQIARNETVRVCGKYAVNVPYGMSDMRVRIAVTDGLSGLRIGISREPPEKLSCLMIYGLPLSELMIPELHERDGVACYDRSIRIGFCETVARQQTITILLQPFDGAYPAPTNISVTFTNNFPVCDTKPIVPTTTVVRPVQTETLPSTTTSRTLPPRRFGVSSVPSLATRLRQSAVLVLALSVFR